MKRRELARLDSELTGYLDSLSQCLKRSDQRRSFASYIHGLLLDGERKSIEPIASRLVDAPSEREAMRQRLQQIVSVAPWAESALYQAVAGKLDNELPGVEALVVDDTGFPKKGTHSVGVARQYSGTLGRTDTCQVATSLHLAGEQGSGCIGMRLYLPDAWVGDAARRAKAGIPAEVEGATKWQLALEQIKAALSWGVRHHVVLADAGYGDATEFRDGLAQLGLRYITGVSGKHTVYPEGVVPAVPEQKPRGRAPSRQMGSEVPQSISVTAAKLSYRKITWRAGSKGVQSSYFAAVRLYSAERRTKGRVTNDAVWLLCERPKEAVGPTKFWFSNLPASTSVKSLVRLVKLRWRVERDYQEMKQEVGLDHFEGRTWRGFHHHAAMCAAAHAFLALQRALFPPEEEAMDAA